MSGVSHFGRFLPYPQFEQVLQERFFKCRAMRYVKILWSLTRTSAGGVSITEFSESRWGHDWEITMSVLSRLQSLNINLCSDLSQIDCFIFHPTSESASRAASARKQESVLRRLQSV